MQKNEMYLIPGSDSIIQIQEVMEDGLQVIWLRPDQEPELDYMPFNENGWEYKLQKIPYLI